jgi:hypothetical protein
MGISSWIKGFLVVLTTASLGKFPEQDPMGLDSHECFAEVHKHRDVENAIEVQV